MSKKIEDSLLGLLFLHILVVVAYLMTIKDFVCELIWGNSVNAGSKV